MKVARPPHQDTTVAVSRADTATVPTVVVPDAGVDLQSVERALILFALETAAGNRTRAARFLGLSSSALIYRMHKYGFAGNAGSEQ